MRARQSNSTRRTVSRLGDTYFDATNGYIIECVRGHVIDFGRPWVAQHIVRMCEKLGRPLHKGEIVHHRDHNKTSNGRRNLKLVTRKTHMAEHRGIKRSEEIKVRMRAAAIARCTLEWRTAVSARVKEQHQAGRFGRKSKGI